MSTSPAMTFAAPADVQLGGRLGAALSANLTGRLLHFIESESSPAIRLFAPEHALGNREGDWYGEHAGKWLWAAASAANRTGDVTLSERVRRIADHLISLQDADGYLGTYAPERRFTHPARPAPRTWDGAPAERTWDIWTHSYLILGLLQADRYFPDARYVTAARRIGDLCRRVLESGTDITRLGNHFGLSATVLLDPAVELYFATRDRSYLDLAELIVQQANARPELALVTQALAGADASEIATGKAYQLCWNLLGLAKLHRATGTPQYLEAVERLWTNIRDHHLTLGGGPWGGVAHRSREVFNHSSVFSPHGYVETCATLAWIELSRELLGITGLARYAEEIERSAYNSLLGAQAPDGEDWCYYTFANGRRVHTTYWRCCKSSGAMALEALPGLAYSLTAAGGIAINVYGPGTAQLVIPRAGRVQIEQSTRYPFEGAIKVRLTPQHPARFQVLLRIPSWAEGASIHVRGERIEQRAEAGSYATIERVWSEGDEIALALPMQPQLHRRSSCSVQVSRAPDGEPVEQEVMRYDYLALTRGPLVYATSLRDENAVRVEPHSEPKLDLADAPPGMDGPALHLCVQGRSPLVFVPYYEAGGRVDGAWRLTWLSVAPGEV